MWFKGITSLLFVLILKFMFQDISVAQKGETKLVFKSVGVAFAPAPFKVLRKDLNDSISLQSEVITILLYKGFAVVKGEYYFYNKSNEDISLTMGYPKRGKIEHYLIKDIEINEFIIHEAFANKEKLKIRTIMNNYFNKGYWHAWKVNFKARDYTKVDVHQLVETNLAILNEGYDNHYNCGFVFNLEYSGLWKSIIKTGRVCIKLMDDLELREIKGLLPSSTFYHDGDDILIYDFEKISPTGLDNIIVRYGKRDTDFTLDSVKANYKHYFQVADKQSVNLINKVDFTIFTNDNFSMSLDFPPMFWIIVSSIFLISCILIYRSVFNP